MVTAVITEQPPTNSGGVNVGGFFSNPVFGFIGDHFFAIFFLLILAVLVGFFIWWWMTKEEDLREQEDMLYKEFKDTVRSCEKNSDSNKYTKHYSKWNFLLLGIPIFHYRRGAKIFDSYKTFKGWYGGVYVDYLGNYNVLMWRSRYLLFFKDWFVLRCPTVEYQYREIKPKSIKQKEVAEQKDVKDYEVKSFKLPDGLYIEREKIDGWSIDISMIGLKRHGYYWYPVYEDINKRILNLQESINAMNKINHGDVLLHQVIKEGGKQVLNMAKYNTGLTYEKQAPDKVKDIPKDQ